MKIVVAGFVGALLALLGVFGGVAAVQNSSSVTEPGNPMAVQYADQ